MLLLLLAACLTEPAVPAPAEPDPVTRAVELATAVRADPEHAVDALAAKGGSEEELYTLLYTIAADPAQSEAYAVAMGEPAAGATQDAGAAPATPEAGGTE